MRSEKVERARVTPPRNLRRRIKDDDDDGRGRKQRSRDFRRLGDH